MRNCESSRCYPSPLILPFFILLLGYVKLGKDYECPVGLVPSRDSAPTGA